MGTDGGLEEAWVEIYFDAGLPVEQFPSQVGTSGVDFAGLPRARWYAELHLATRGDSGPRGQVTVEGITSEGVIVQTPVEELTWSLE